MASFVYCKKCLYITSAIVVGVGIYILINRNRKKKMIEEINAILDGNQTTSPNDLKPDQISKLADLKFPLKLGAYGRQVAEIQKAMNVKYGLSLKIDARLGEDTLKALCKYYFSTCLSWVPLQWATYSVSADDYNNIVNRTSKFSGAVGIESRNIESFVNN